MMYSKQDIKEMFEKVKNMVIDNSNEEISYYLNMNCNYLSLKFIIAIFVQLILHEAEKSNVILKVETSQVENM